MDRTSIFLLRKQRNKGLQNPALSLSVGFSTQNCSFSKGPQTHPSLVISTQNCSCSNALNFGFLEIFLDAPNKLQDIFCRNRNFYPLQHCLVPSKIPFFFLILQQRRAHVIRIHSLQKKKKNKNTGRANSRPCRPISLRKNSIFLQLRSVQYVNLNIYIQFLNNFHLHEFQTKLKTVI